MSDDNEHHDENENGAAGQETTFDSTSRVVNGLLDLAEKIESGELEEPETCVICTSGAGQMVWVHTMGEACTSEDAIISLAKGHHCMMNAIMPNGSQKGTH